MITLELKLTQTLKKGSTHPGFASDVVLTKRKA
jgi:hypothetical protein